PALGAGQLLFDLRQAQQQRPFDGKAGVQAVVIGLRATQGLLGVVADFAVEAVVGHQAGMRAPVGALAFDVEVLARVAALQPAFGPGPGRSEDDDLVEPRRHPLGGLHIVQRHAILVMSKRSVQTDQHCKLQQLCSEGPKSGPVCIQQDESRNSTFKPWGRIASWRGNFA
ncbi:Uncharacterized protein APZ42_002563, partial [Daphnia magna]